MPQGAINPNQLGAFQFPVQGPLGNQTPAFEMPDKPANLASLYGLMAQYADKPAQIGMDYAARMQQQQNLNAQNSPYMQMLQIYGKVNPHDFEADSIQKFHEKLMQGEFRLDLLERYNPYSNIEQQAMKEANEAALKSQDTMGRMAGLANRFEAAHKAGEIRSGWGGSIEEFVRGGLGVENGVSQLRTEFNNLVNSAVINSLPPGVASDTDIALARQGWPKDTSNPETVAALLRVMRAVEAYKYAQNLYRARYISNERDERYFLDSWNDVKGHLVPQVMQEFGIPMGIQIDAGYANPYTGGGDDTAVLTPTGAEDPASIRERYNIPPPPR
jgi:hypothetical protein